MRRFFDKPYAYAYFFAIFLTLFTVFALLDVFVIPHSGAAVQPPAAAEATAPASATPNRNTMVPTKL